MQLVLTLGLLTLMIFVLVIFTVLLLHKGRKQYSNILLAVYFISQIIGLSDDLLYYAASPNEGMLLATFPVIFTWAPLFFLYIISLLDNDFNIKWIHSIHLLPFVVVLVYSIIVYYSKDYISRMMLINSFQIQNDLYGKFSIVFQIQIFGYIIWSLILYHIYQKRLKEEYSVIDRAANNWLKISLFGFVAACLIVQVGIHSKRLGILTFVNWDVIGYSAFFLFFVILFYKAIVNPYVILRSSNREKYKYSSLGHAEALKMLSALEQFMEIQKPYTDSMLSLKTLAQLSGIPERALSQIINEHRNQNFFDFVNSYRIKYATELLKNHANSKRIMLDILFEAGFNSKSTFNSAFKKHTGLTPSNFKANFGILA